MKAVLVGGLLLAGAALGAYNLLPSAVATPATVGVELVAEGLTAPTMLAAPPDGSGRLFVLEQTGQIRIIDAAGELLAQPFLDFRTRLDPTIEPGFDERGALGLAFHPDYAKNGLLYVYYSAPLRPDHELLAAEWGSHTTRLVELKASAEDPNVADPGYERLLLEQDEMNFAHNAGSLNFGPDGYLYIAMGDGGGAPGDADFPPEGTSQRGDSLLGKILRIDVEQTAGAAYGIPPDNPFVDRAGYRPEIFALGLRNPYRMSIDPETGQIFVGDVGQNAYEEIDLIAAGGNYGWPIKEATHCFDWDDFEGHHDRCDSTGLTDPIIEYKNGGMFPEQSEGRSTVGAVLYRGAAIPGLAGKLVFADWSKEGGEPSGVLYVGMPADAGERWAYQPLQIEQPFAHFILSLATDAEQELYVLTSDMVGPEGTTGKVFKLVSAAPGATS